MTRSAVIFDLDGTLIDSLDDLTAAANHAIAPYGIGAHDRNACRMMIGDGAEMLIRRALGDDHAEDLSDALERFKQFYAQHMTDHTRLYPGVAELLDALTQQKIPMAVLSNKPHTATKRVVSDLLDRWSWTDVVGQRDGIPIKPDPTAALAMCEQCSWPIHQCWFVGDSANDILTGRHAGMTPVGVTWGMRPKQELTEAGAQILIDHPSELLNALPPVNVQS